MTLILIAALLTGALKPIAIVVFIALYCDLLIAGILIASRRR